MLMDQELHTLERTIIPQTVIFYHARGEAPILVDQVDEGEGDGEEAEKQVGQRQVCDENVAGCGCHLNWKTAKLFNFMKKIMPIWNCTENQFVLPPLSYIGLTFLNNNVKVKLLQGNEKFTLRECICLSKSNIQNTLHNRSWFGFPALGKEYFF